MKCIAKRARERDETKMCGRRQTKSNVYVWIIVYVGRSRKMCSMAARSNNVSFYAEESCRPKRVSLWGRMFIAIEKRTAAATTCKRAEADVGHNGICRGGLLP